MGSRLYTRGGDGGETSLLDGTRVPKDAERLEAYGTLDEACSIVGAARAHVEDGLLDGLLEFFQHRLYNCSSGLAAPPGTSAHVPLPGRDDVNLLERAIDRFEESTGGLDAFVLPGGSVPAGLLHVARTVCRRAERRLVTLAATEPVDAGLVAFVNRGSDFLFAAARYANRLQGAADVHWDRHLPPPSL
jgi:cob(I)alamin adenosyltransferase